MIKVQRLLILNNKKAQIILGFFCLISLFTYSQDQKLSDSLKIVFKENQFKSEKKLEILDEIAFNETNTDEIFIYANKLIEFAKEMNSVEYLYSGFLQVGNAHRLNGDLTKALENYFKASKVAEENNLLLEQASIKIAIGDAYSIIGDNTNAVSYYRNGINLLKIKIETKTGQWIDSINLGSAQLNLGDEYYNQQKLDSALYYFNESGEIFKEAKYEIGEAYNLGNIGLVYAKKGKNTKAEKNLNKAVNVLTEMEDYYPISVYLNAMSDVYASKNLNNKALQYANRSLLLAKKYDLKEQIGDGYLKLHELHENRNQYKTSLNFYKKHIVYRDSVKNNQELKDFEVKQKQLEKEKELAIQEKENEIVVAKKQAEIELSNQKAKTTRIIAIGIALVLILIAVLAVLLYKRNKDVVKTSKIIESEKERSDNLLKNILPEETALELKESGVVKAKRFDNVSVLFTDFKGFTKFSETLSPEELVETIDFYFSKFDEIMEKYGIEKIKTVGDAYMCACGLPDQSENHAYKITNAAFEIIDFVNETMSSDSHKAGFDIRVGINSGSVVAGVVGTKKFAYDIWGDAVNTASRMESSGEIGKVNISESTYELLKSKTDFKFESRGAIEAKGKGKISMYFVSKTT